MGRNVAMGYGVDGSDLVVVVIISQRLSMLAVDEPAYISSSREVIKGA